MNLDDRLREELESLEQDSLRRSLRVPTGTLNFASNDYLGLSRHLALIEAAQRATAEHGTGAGASRLVTGTSRDVLDLEQRLAAWKEKEAALVFGSGYSAALGTIPALVGAGDTVILDKLAHASLIDAARLSGATLRVVPHNNTKRLETLLARKADESGRVLLVTESLFSMDGDEAHLLEWVRLKERYGAWLLVDEAHATGLYGKTGAGLVQAAGLSSGVDVVLGTLSKALGSVGGYIAGSQTLVDWLVNRARSFIYSTALPPGAIAASRAAIELIQSGEGGALRARLKANIAQFRHALPNRWPSPVSGAIQPLLCGEAQTALRLAAALDQRGFFLPAIRFPTVPRQGARLRTTLSAAHSSSDIGSLTEALSFLADFAPAANET